MQLLKLTVADLPTDDRDTPTRSEWINPDHIETAVAYLTWPGLTPTLWLELTLASGTVRYSLIGPVPLGDIDTATEDAIARLASHPNPGRTHCGSTRCEDEARPATRG